MSFFTGGRSDRTPGPIAGNPLSGICERVCIETKKVFDACLSQIQENNLLVTVTNQTPPAPVTPLTFVSARSTSTVATISNLSVERFEDRPNFARVTLTATIPIEVTYTDANGVEGTGTSTVSITKDIVLYVPQASIIPYEIEGIGVLISTTGSYVSGSQFSINACITLIIKVVAESNLLIPSYGYAAVPPCQDYTQEVCPGLFELPLYPNAAPTPR
ncbi:MAG: hypothetical protein WCX32_01685 [Clostridia bacterium]